MKVFELLENEWENVPVAANQHIAAINKRLHALDHRAEVIRQKLLDIRSMSADKRGQAQYHRMDALDRALTDIREQKAKLMKDSVSARINMKYVKYDPELAYWHAKSVRGGQYPEGEDAIASNPETAVRYALEVIHQRFPKGEPVMKTASPDSKSNLADLFKQYERMFNMKLNRSKPKV